MNARNVLSKILNDTYIVKIVLFLKKFKNYYLQKYKESKKSPFVNIRNGMLKGLVRKCYLLDTEIMMF